MYFSIKNKANKTNNGTLIIRENIGLPSEKNFSITYSSKELEEILKKINEKKPLIENTLTHIHS